MGITGQGKIIGRIKSSAIAQFARALYPRRENYVEGKSLEEVQKTAGSRPYARGI